MDLQERVAEIVTDICRRAGETKGVFDDMGEVFLRTFAAVRGRDDIRDLERYARKVAKRVCQRRHRLEYKHRRRSRALPSPDLRADNRRPAPCDDVADQVGRADELARLREAVGRLPAADRELLLTLAAGRAGGKLLSAYAADRGVSVRTARRRRAELAAGVRAQLMGGRP